MPAEPLWVTVDDALFIHDMQLRAHGGPRGLRDRGGLESALDRPRNMYVYSRPNAPDRAMLAAAYAYGIARNHPFIDGNKRTSLGVCLVFLRLNGLILRADTFANTAKWEELAAGLVTEGEFADWLRERVMPLG